LRLTFRMAQSKEYAEKLRLAKEKLEKDNRKEAKRKRDKAKEHQRPKKTKKTALTTRRIEEPNWNDEAETAESDDGTGTSTTNSASGSENESNSHGEVAQEGSNGNHDVRDVSCSDGMASSSLTPLTFPRIAMEEVSIVVGKKLSLSQSIKAAQKFLLTGFKLS
jgi:hypothetical protein